jgi:hypothetical protein
MTNRWDSIRDREATLKLWASSWRALAEQYGFEPVRYMRLGGASVAEARRVLALRESPWTIGKAAVQVAGRPQSFDLDPVRSAAERPPLADDAGPGARRHSLAAAIRTAPRR